MAYFVGYHENALIQYTCVFLSALLPFCGRFPVSPTDRRVSAVHPAWPDGSPKTVPAPPSPGPSLWATTDGWRCLALGPTLWSCSHPYIQVHNVNIHKINSYLKVPWRGNVTL